MLVRIRGQISIARALCEIFFAVFSATCSDLLLLLFWLRLSAVLLRVLDVFSVAVGLVLLLLLLVVLLAFLLVFLLLLVLLVGVLLGFFWLQFVAV